MNDEISSQILQQLKELNQKSLTIPRWMQKCFVLFLLILLVPASIYLGRNILSDLFPARHRDADLFATRHLVEAATWTRVNSLLDRGDLNEALAVVARLEAKAPTDYNVPVQRGVIFLRMQNYEQALQEFKKAYDIVPDEKVAEHIKMVATAMERKKQGPSDADKTK